MLLKRQLQTIENGFGLLPKLVRTVGVPVLEFRKYALDDLTIMATLFNELLQLHDRLEQMYTPVLHAAYRPLARRRAMPMSSQIAMN